jgi:hypothetical protein
MGISDIEHVAEPIGSVKQDEGQSAIGKYIGINNELTAAAFAPIRLTECKENS